MSVNRHDWQLGGGCRRVRGVHMDISVTVSALPSGLAGKYICGGWAGGFPSEAPVLGLPSELNSSPLLHGEQMPRPWEWHLVAGST